MNKIPTFTEWVNLREGEKPLWAALNDLPGNSSFDMGSPQARAVTRDKMAQLNAKKAAQTPPPPAARPRPVPPPLPKTYRVDPQKTQADMSLDDGPNLGSDTIRTDAPERTIMSDPEKLKIMKLLQDLSKVDPKRAKWFARVMEHPGNISRIDRVANQIHTVEDLLRLIGTIEAKERSRRANADTFVN